MATPFARTLRSIQEDGFGFASVLALAGLGVLGGWCAWLCAARVDVVERCADARVVARGALHPLESAVAGTLVASRLELSRAVRAGEVLVELDASALALEADEERARAEAAAAELGALETALARSDEAAALARSASQAAAEEQRLEAAGRALALSLAREEAARLEALAQDGIVSELELVRARGAVESASLGVELQAAAAERRRREEARAGAERDAARAELERERERQHGLAAAARARLATLAHAIDERRVRAPHDGVVAERRELAAGARVEAGERLGALVADGALGVVAELAPAAALGRVAPGQSGTLRLDGFPWSRFGALDVRVARVGAEPRDGRVQLELDVVRASPAIPLQHGLSGTLELVVERASPLELLLRAAGLAAGGGAGAP